jgi:phosphotransferase system HPr (HPr) family protein
VYGRLLFFTKHIEQKTKHAVKYSMHESTVIVKWEAGLHLRPAAKLVKLGQEAQSSILIKSGNKVANIKNIMSILMLCATVGTTLTIEASGADEEEVTQNIEQLFLDQNA